MREFLHGEDAHAGLVQMDAVAVPDLVGAVPHALVQEGEIRLVRRGAYLLGVNRFRALAEDIGGGEPDPVVADDRDGRLHLQVHAVGRMADILALGIVRCGIIGLDAEGELLRERGGEAATQLVGLARLVSGGEFQHIDGEIARLQEHGRKLFFPFDLFEGEGAREGRVFPVVRALRRGAGLPERGRGESGMIATRLVAAVHAGLACGARLRVQPQEADVLALKGQRHQQKAKDAGSVSRSHRSRCLNCSCPSGPRTRSPRKPSRPPCAGAYAPCKYRSG